MGYEQLQADRLADRGRDAGAGAESAAVGLAAGARKAPSYETAVKKPRISQTPSQDPHRHRVGSVTLTSAFRPCFAGRAITVYKENGSIDKPVDGARTNQGGKAAFNADTTSGFFYVRAEKKVGDNFVCPSRRSVVASGVS